MLIDNWNQCVDAEDQVFFLGDFGFGDVEHLHSICSQLNGHKICIRGNHGRNASYMMRVGFSLVLESAFWKIGQHNVELVQVMRFLTEGLGKHLDEVLDTILRVLSSLKTAKFLTS